MNIKHNLKWISSEIKSNTDQPVTIVAVTKNRSVADIKTLLESGITEIAESRLQEAVNKLTDFPENIRKHFIGPLQTNKVREVVALFDVIQSVDRLKLARKIDAESEKIGKTMPILIQVNTSSESQKGGCKPDEAESLIKEVAKLKHVEIQGLMTIAINSDDTKKVSACFHLLKKLFDSIDVPGAQMKFLSMGMSKDYPLAIEGGANMVRIGRELFIEPSLSL